jgi:hypothetical protein
MTGQEREALTDEQLAEIARLLIDPDADACLPEEEWLEYRRCQRSVVEARRYAEAHAGEHYVY